MPCEHDRALGSKAIGERRQARLAPAYRYEATARFITDLVDNGTLIPGARVPSLRQITKQRGVSLSTALQAYRTLEDRGILQARPQSGFYVAKGAPFSWRRQRSRSHRGDPRRSPSPVSSQNSSSMPPIRTSSRWAARFPTPSSSRRGGWTASLRGPRGSTVVTTTRTPSPRVIHGYAERSLAVRCAGGKCFHRKTSPSRAVAPRPWSWP